MRIILFICAAWLFFTDRERLDFTALPHAGGGAWFLYAVFLMLAASMLPRFFPNQRVAIGARKHYSCSYRAAPAEKQGVPSASSLHRGALTSALAWICFNGALFFLLSRFSLRTPEIALLLVLFYAVCDLICILFFCPFQVLFLHNRCCTVCRIYNWDCIMMCTPLFFFPCAYTIPLLLISIAVLARWEISVWRNPHFFLEDTNLNLRCAHCAAPLCRQRGKYGRRKAVTRRQTHP